MSDFIKQSNIGNSFYFPISFNLDGYTKIINRACYDTGCSRSFISYNLVCDSKYLQIFRLTDPNSRSEELKKYINRLKINDILNPYIELSASFGVESQSGNTFNETKRLFPKINLVNEIKRLGLANGKSIDAMHKEIKSAIDAESLNKILYNKNIRYGHIVTNYKIGDLHIGKSKINICYDYDNVALIGMYIIGKLNTQIVWTGHSTCLVASTNPDIDYINNIAKTLKIEDNTPIDFSNQVLEANYIHQKQLGGII